MLATSNIRNVCLMGHGSDGKTSLAESLLFVTHGTDRLGKIADGNTVCDYDPEEIRRKITISATIAPIEYDGYKINLMDTPGYFDFSGEIMQTLRVADLGLILCTAKNGVGVGTEKSWRYLSERKLPRALYVSKLDEENADFYKAYEALREHFGPSVCPLVVPVLDGSKTIGLVDIASKKAFRFEGGNSVAMDLPASMTARVEELYTVLAEHVAETDETLMERFFEGATFTKEEIIQGMKSGIAAGTLTPVLCGSALTGLGAPELLYALTRYAPDPLNRATERAALNDTPVEIAIDPNAPARAFVFKTLSDQYGKFSFFRVMSGKITADMTLINARTGQQEKIGHLYTVRGKKNIEVKEICCGDIGAVSKLIDTRTGDSLCAAGAVVAYEGVTYAKPCYSLAFAPKIKGGEEKIATGLHRMAEEDLTFSVVQNAETHQMVVSGAGDIHLDVLCSRLKTKFGVEVETSAPRVPYREKIRKKVKVEGKHKKQSGGHGQFGHVWIEFEPGTQEDLQFEEKIFGGSVPKNFHPAVEKGLRDRLSRGILAGFPVVFLKATLVDGSYHDVDSSEMAFKTAAGNAFKAGLPLANPVLLEPIGTLKVSIPDQYTGDVMGDLNKRRGRVMGMNPSDNGEQIVEAEVPMSEMHSYAIDLRSMSQGRGSFTFTFERYDEAPAIIQQKVIEDTKHLLAADDD